MARKQSRAERLRQKQIHYAKMERQEKAALEVAEAAVERQRKAPAEIVSDSQQPRFSQTHEGAFFALSKWAEEIEAEWDSRPYNVNSTDRDQWLQTVWLRVPYWSSLVSQMCMINSNRHWEMIGGRNQVRKYSYILNNSDGGAGWARYVQRESLSFYNTDMQALTEVARSGDSYIDKNGVVYRAPMSDIYFLDSARCYLTGNVLQPLVYKPASGTMQKWNPWDYFRTTNLVSDVETMNGLAYCATSLAIEMIRLLYAVTKYDQEKLYARVPKGFLLFKNFSEADVKNTLTSGSLELDALGRRYFSQAYIIGGDDSSDIVQVPISSWPDSFERTDFVNEAMYTFGMILGVSARDLLWPVSMGSLGSGHETETQHKSSTSRGLFSFARSHQEMLQRELPETLTFEYDETDSEGELIEQQVNAAKIANVVSLYTASDGARSLMSFDEARQQLVDFGIIPAEWTIANEDVQVTDVEDESLEEETPEDALMENLRVRRAIETFPEQPIIRMRWERGRLKERILWTHRERRFQIVMSGLKQRTIAQVTSEYADRLRNLIQSAWNLLDYSGLSYAQAAPGLIENARTQHKRMVRTLGPEAYAEGAREGGLPPDELDDEDRRAIKDWVGTQLPHVNDFVKAAIEAGKPEGNREEILQRIDLWVGAMTSLGQSGILAANKNQMLTFDGQDGHENCKTCRKLKGQRHRARWWRKNGLEPTIQNSANFECGIFNCRHGLKNDAGEWIITPNNGG